MIDRYLGYKKISAADKDLAELYENSFNGDSLLENEYMIVEDQGKTIDYFVKKDGELKRVIFPSLGNGFTGAMKPRNPEQYCAMDLLKDDNVPIKLITGSFGSGKTMMCIIAALDAIQRGDFERIVFIRNNVQVKDTDSLGALPGGEFEKTLPYVMPFADHCGGEEGIIHLMRQGQLEVIPLAFLRGRSIRNSIIYSMESENLTKEHIQLIMGRVDEGSQLWMDGDIKQRDRASFEKSQGLETMIERLKGNKLFGYVHLVKSERSEVARMADLLD